MLMPLVGEEAPWAGPSVEPVTSGLAIWSLTLVGSRPRLFPASRGSGA